MTFCADLLNWTSQRTNVNNNEAAILWDKLERNFFCWPIANVSLLRFTSIFIIGLRVFLPCTSLALNELRNSVKEQGCSKKQKIPLQLLRDFWSKFDKSVGRDLLMCCQPEDGVIRNQLDDFEMQATLLRRPSVYGHCTKSFKISESNESSMELRLHLMICQ